MSLARRRLSSVGLTTRRSTGFLSIQRRFATTGSQHEFEPGPFARACRSLFTVLMPNSARKTIAKRMQRGIEQVKKMEDENDWLRRHGSPLQVLNLPEHAEMPEVKQKYKELLLDTHPDTSMGKGTREEYELVRKAYEIINNPQSTWYLTGHGEHLLAQVRKSKPRIEPVVAFAAMSYIIGGAICTVLITVVAYYFFMGWLYLVDPKFFNKMIDKEKDEERRRLAGEEVDVNPMRLAPQQTLFLSAPGKYLADNEDADR